MSLDGEFGLVKSLDKNIERISELFPVGKSFDIVTREMNFGSTRAYWIGINGMFDSEVMQLMLSDLQNPIFTKDDVINNLEEYVTSKTSVAQMSLEGDIRKILKNVVSGPAAILVDGFEKAIIIDLRKYPVRSIEEPENEKVLRGAKDGFVETLLFNANLIRRRIRNFNLTFEINTIGNDSKSDVAIAYVGGIANEKLIDDVRTAIKKVDVDSLTLGSKSLEELLVKKRWFNPLPSIQITERPDVACSYLEEGYVLVIVDNSPSVIILPGNIFQFSQSPEDYYRNPLTGNMFRLLRNLSVIISLYLLPVFLLIVGHMPDLAEKLSLISDELPGAIRLLCFVIFAEFGLDMLEYASSHSPGNLITPVSVVGGIVLGEMAVNMQWFSEEVLFYSAISLLTTFVISSHEFSDALRLFRIVLIILTGLFGIPGIIIASILVIASVLTTPSFADSGYFWPLYPFNGPALKALVFRKTTISAQPDVRKRKKTPY